MSFVSGARSPGHSQLSEVSVAPYSGSGPRPAATLEPHCGDVDSTPRPPGSHGDSMGSEAHPLLGLLRAGGLAVTHW